MHISSTISLRIPLLVQQIGIVMPGDNDNPDDDDNSYASHSAQLQLFLQFWHVVKTNSRRPFARRRRLPE